MIAFAQDSKTVPSKAANSIFTPLPCGPQIVKDQNLTGMVRVSAGVIAPLVRKRTLPDVHDLKKELKGEQTVKVNVLFDSKGEVACAGAAEGLPLLFERSVEAAKEWKFSPYVLNGKPVAVQSTIEFHFKGSKVKSVP